MENKSTVLGVGIAVLTVGLGYLGYTVLNNQEWTTVNVEKQNNVEKINSGETLEQEVVKKVSNNNGSIAESLLTRFWKNEFNEGFKTKVEDLE